MEVSPIRVYMNQTHPITSMKLTNKSEHPIYLQLKSMQWGQNSEIDTYAQTNDIIISPPMTVIMPGEKQLVRLALRTKINSDSEKTYRIFIQQIPKFQSDSLGVSFNLQIGIPLFIEPTVFSAKKLNWKVSVQNNRLQIKITNPSVYHVQLTHFKITSNNKDFFSKNIFSYILPKQTRQFSYPLKNKIGKDIYIEAMSDWGPIQFRAKI
jgi:fimbrial chaperone protein